MANLWVDSIFWIFTKCRVTHHFTLVRSEVGKRADIYCCFSCCCWSCCWCKLWAANGLITSINNTQFESFFSFFFFVDVFHLRPSKRAHEVPVHNLYDVWCVNRAVEFGVTAKHSQDRQIHNSRTNYIIFFKFSIPIHLRAALTLMTMEEETWWYECEGEREQRQSNQQ